MRHAWLGLLMLSVGIVVGWTAAKTRWSAQAQFLPNNPVAPGQTTPVVPALGAGIPRFAPVSNSYSNNLESGVFNGPARVRLDGFETSHNIWASPQGVVFEYGGGAYKLTDARISGPVTLELEGAAANTVSLLELFGVIGRPPYVVSPPASMAAPTPAEQNQKITKKIRVKNFRGDMSSRFLEQK